MVATGFASHPRHLPHDRRFEPLPKTATGKIQKFQLRERAREPHRE